MNKKGFTILAVLVFALGTFGLAHALSTYWNNFKLAYPSSPLIPPSTVTRGGRRRALR